MTKRIVSRLFAGLLCSVLLLLSGCVFGTDFGAASGSNESETGNDAGDTAASDIDVDSSGDSSDGDAPDTGANCDPGLTFCGGDAGSCVNTNSNVDHCGRCGNDCGESDVPNAEATCRQGDCVHVCEEGYHENDSGTCVICEGSVDEDETCNGIDDDCDGEIDEELGSEYVGDTDDDTYYGPDTGDCDYGGGFDTLRSDYDGEVDCDDDDPNVNPGVTSYFTTPHENVGFDYNCSGENELQSDQRAVCQATTIGGQCTVLSCVRNQSGGGWSYQEPPGCGEKGQWLESCSGCVLTGQNCTAEDNASSTERLQGCH